MKKLFTFFTAVFSLAITPFAATVFAQEPCEPVALVSDTADMVVGDGNAVAVAVHPAWTASIPGATWIWKSGATAPNEIVGFEKTFTVPGNFVTSALLDVASDNSYKVFIDNVQVAAAASATNFTLATQDSHDLTADVSVGTHTLRIEVKNHGTFNAQTNPAGLLYKFTVKSDCCGDDNGDVVVVNENEAIVINEAGTSANSGDNSANGGNGGSAGNGGSIIDSDDSNTGGNGGNAGNGGNGGSVTTGNASAGTVIGNVVNYNTTTIDRCGCCCGDTNGDDTALNSNGALVLTGAGTGANSGSNSTDGGFANGAGNGGDVEDSDDSNTAGNGGNSGNGGTGGSTNTGSVLSLSGILNSVNTNITWIRR